MTGIPSKDEILKQGYVDVKVFVSGLRQAHRLQVERQQTAHGMVPFLVSKYYIPTPELLRLAEVLQLPIKCRGISIFPKGKMAGHFAEKQEGKENTVVATVQSDTVEAEIEEGNEGN